MHRQLRTALATAAAAALTGGLLVVTASTATAATPSGTRGDFNGDGYGDVAVTAPLASVNGTSGAGSVSILYGSKSGAGAAKVQTVSQNSAGVPGAAEKDDTFGGTAAAGDFNGDGYLVTFNSNGKKLAATGKGYGLTATKVSAAGTPLLGFGMTG
ncbi:integrin alpha [Streptomyces sp. NBC_01471]|uniref:integrin alpha n=1 Tax=Streptomyces sp. NBC_01471 TaxID=2903879 RepID=UPI00325248ED